ncbi:MAG: Rpn family recombination-promoting nuclease/putative transposase [Bacteroidales bacterium]|nr:Rpn family recombination-promoting nuclease/putative transposase [Bacteroidales bacterium]
MDEIKLTPEQMAQYKAIVDEVENLRTLSDAEKEKLVRDIMEKPFLDLLCDVAFKYVFQQDMDSLLMLLNDFLPETIVEVSTEPNELVSPVAEDKKPVIDILAKTKDGHQIIIEMQQERRKAFFPRLYYYGSKLLSQQLKKGDHYKDLMPVFVICFTNFKMKHKGCPEGQLVYEYQHREKEGGSIFTKLHTTYICELPRLAQKALKDMNPIENWFYILRNCSNFASKPEGMDPRYDHIIEAAKTNRVPDKERTQYFKAMLSEYDKKDIGDAYYEQGKEDERKKWLEKQRKSVLAFLDKRVDVHTIAECIGLTVEEVEALKQ